MPLQIFLLVLFDIYNPITNLSKPIRPIQYREKKQLHKNIKC